MNFGPSNLTRLGVLFLSFILVDQDAAAQSTGLSREVFTGIPGNTIADLTSAPSFPGRPAVRGVLVDYFETPLDFADQYGQRIRGFLSPPETGEYTFWIASDDQSVLYLGVDEDPARKRLIAAVNGWTGYRDWFAEPNQQSVPVRLEAGRYYYIEALMKEGGGGDHLSVRWARPSGGIEEPIPASYFFPFGTPLFPPRITREPASISVLEGGSATFRVEVSNSDTLTYQWQRDGRPIPGATRSSFTFARVQMSDDGARFRCTLSNPLGFALSEEAVLTVLPDRTAPAVVSVHNASMTNLVVRFTEPVATNTAWVATNYSLDGGVSVLSVVRGAGEAEVLLGTSVLTPGTRYTLTVNRVTDRALNPNPIAPDTRFAFVALSLVPAAIGRPPEEGVVEAVPGGLDITALGLGLAGTNDQVHFSHQPRTGDFDVRVRVESLQVTSLFAQAGLMVRQSLSSTSIFAASLATPGLAGSQFLSRAATGAVVTAQGSFPVNYPETWLRLKRAGSNFTGYASYDGSVWSRLGSESIAMSNAVYLGLVVGSRATNEVAAAAFRDYGDVEPVVLPGSLPERREPLGPSSRRTPLVISEIMYHPAPRADGRQLEYLELFNADSAFADLSGFRLAGDVSFVLPPGTVIPAGGFLVVAQAPDDLLADGGATNVLGPWTGRLPRESGTVRLLHRTGALLLEVTYSDEWPWPAAADGGGHSLVLARPSYGEGEVRAWSASDLRGGSPGRAEVIRRDPLRGVVINEILAHADPPRNDFLELYNRSDSEADLSDCLVTDDPGRARFRLPAGTVIPPRGRLVLDEAALGFAFSAAGEAVYLINADETRVVDAIRFGPQSNGVSSGRVPDGSETWDRLAAPSPGGPNGEAWSGDIVINEIMYNPPGGSLGEFVELYNRGARPVNLRNWRFVDGITFVFTNDVILDPGAYLVVAADATYLRTTYPGLPPARVVGNFIGNLSGQGERLALAQPEIVVAGNAAGQLETNTVFVTVNEVSYRDGGRWGRWSDGGGSSLELIDPRSNNRLAANWADSDESEKSRWSRVDFSGLLELGQGDAGELHVMLLGAGECLIDNIQVLDQGGANLVPNATLEAGLAGWIAQGNHVATGLATNGFESRRSLALRASAGGDNGANRAKIDLQGGGLLENAFATLRADVRWLRGHPDLLLRLKGNYLETVAHLAIPANLGTPGAPNSRLVTNAGPAIVEVSHEPVVPQALEAVRITARVDDPDGIGLVKLKYRFDPSVSVHELIMRDDGQDGDALAGDGFYTATLPGQAAGVLVAFWVEAADAANRPARATFPVEPARGECLVRFGDAIPAGSFGTYRLWMTQKAIDTWTQREVMSNEGLDGTIIYGTQRAIYNGTARYRGSSWIRPGYDSPVGSLCGYIWTVPSDDLLLGSDEFNLDWLEQPGRDSTLQRERMSFWIADQLGVPFSQVRYVAVLVNGVRRGEVYTDSQQPNGEYVSSWFPGADTGEIFKVDDWFEYDDAVQREFNVDARLERYADASGQPHKTRYRWNWEKKSNRGLDDNYDHLLQLVEALNLPPGDLYTQRVEETIDLDGWLRAIAARRVVADWDGYGYGRGKNTFAYLPPGGRWSLLLWDLDFSLGGGSDGSGTEIYNAEDPVMERVYQHPSFGRVYLQAISDAVRGPLAAGIADPVMDANYAAFVGNRIAAASPSPIKTWIASRRDFLARVLATNTAPWSVGHDLTTESGVITLTGTAPIDVRSILVNGFSYVPSWSTRTNWSLHVPLRAGTNQLLLTGVDLRGQPVPGAASHVEAVYTGEDEAPEDFVRISEIMAEPPEPDAEFIEIHNRSTRTTFDLSGWRVDGVDFDFPGGSAIAPGAFLLVVKDRQVFSAIHGTGQRLAGEYPGRLNNAGETIRLMRPGTVSQPYVVVNEVTYDPRAPWPTAAAGSGGSLQVVDVRQDNRRPANWYAVTADGHGYARWQFASVTAQASAASRVLISLGVGGQAHLDDVSLVAGTVPRVGRELIVNGGFEEPLGAHWTAGSVVAASEVDPSVRRGGRASLRLVASAGGGADDRSLVQTLAAPLVPGQFYTLSFWYLANAEGSDLSVRVEGSGPSATVPARELPVLAATPGSPSSAPATLPAFPDVWINEVAPPAPGGVSGGWIELYNAGGVPVDLGGWFLSPDPNDPGFWPFPAGISLGAGQFLVVQAGPGAGPGPRTSFPLSPGSGSVVLGRTVNGVPAALDYLHYQGLVAGRSMGSYPDGAWSQRQIFEVVTPGEPNDLTSQPVRLAINEWMSRNNRTIADPADGDYDDWFEIYNGGDQPIDLGGYSLTDDLAEPRKSVIPAGFILPPRGVMLVWADGEVFQNGPGRELHVAFALSADGETLALFSPGGALVDSVEFGPLGRDVSEGLLPDGEIGSAVILATPSPRALNAGPGPDDLQITGIRVDAAGVLLQWKSVPGRAYRVQIADGVPAAWQDLGPPILASGVTSTASDPSAIGIPVRYYRIVSP